jgi:hypothetical protein
MGRWGVFGRGVGSHRLQGSACTAAVTTANYILRCVLPWLGECT